MGRFPQASFFTKIGTAPRPPEPSINYSPPSKTSLISFLFEACWCADVHAVVGIHSMLSGETVECVVISTQRNTKSPPNLRRETAHAPTNTEAPPSHIHAPASREFAGSQASLKHNQVDSMSPNRV